MQTEKIIIKLSEVKECLRSGYSRLKKDDKGYGSIEEKYGLTAGEVKDLFKCSQLKGLKTKAIRWELCDDEIVQPVGALSATIETK